MMRPSLRGLRTMEHHQQQHEEQQQRHVVEGIDFSIDAPAVIHLVIKRKDAVCERLANYLIEELQHREEFRTKRSLSRGSEEVFEIRCSIEVLVKRAESQGMIKQCVDGSLQAFKLADWDKFEKL